MTIPYYLQPKSDFSFTNILLQKWSPEENANSPRQTLSEKVKTYVLNLFVKMPVLLLATVADLGVWVVSTLIVYPVIGCFKSHLLNLVSLITFPFFAVGFALAGKLPRPSERMGSFPTLYKVVNYGDKTALEKMIKEKVENSEFREELKRYFYSEATIYQHSPYCRDDIKFIILDSLPEVYQEEFLNSYENNKLFSNSPHNALEFAVGHAHLKIFEKMLAINQRTNNSLFSLEDKERAISFLFQRGEYNVDPFSEKSLKILSLLIAEEGIDVNGKDSKGIAPMTHAILKGQKDAAKLLCAAGAHFDVDSLQSLEGLGENAWNVAWEDFASVSTEELTPASKIYFEALLACEKTYDHFRRNMNTIQNSVKELIQEAPEIFAERQKAIAALAIKIDHAMPKAAGILLDLNSLTASYLP